ncbi:alpha/beta hydrolase [Solihabitans fulvus]|uniref:Alpha/beta hydrolase n=1 Tax=Solihabitans fulvus TaxID=1892852 RepID=A0A5B2WZF8_9PSEU|nr:alpha/beta hydrolase [Solihabitans fulvus]KAA2256132.1 alpha/beta hydrolase [Solihabitans fulvus]
MDFLLVHGTTQSPASWQRLTELLERHGHRVRAADFPVDRPELLAADYARIAAEQVELAGAPLVDPVIVAHSAGGLLVPAIAAELGASRLVWLGAVVPDLLDGRSFAEEIAAASHEIFGAEWHTWTEPIAETPAISAYFLFHDCDVDSLRWALTTLRRFNPKAVIAEAPTVGPLHAPSTYVLPTGDRTLTPAWMRAAARDRLDAEIVEIGGDHCPHVSQPELVAKILLGGQASGQLEGA